MNTKVRTSNVVQHQSLFNTKVRPNYDLQPSVVAQWLKGPHREQECEGSIPGFDRPKSIKMAAVASHLGAQDHGDSIMTGPPV